MSRRACGIRRLEREGRIGPAPQSERRPGPWVRAVIGIVFAAGLSGCANLTSIYRVDRISSMNVGRMNFIDAKQRVILSTRVKDPRTAEYVMRYCSEPAPDAFSAFSTSASGDLAGMDLRGASPDVKLRAALALSETAATIERTQTINLLRESMFRTCERYMGGAISNDELIVQAARDQRAMVAVLAIEQLTGVVRAKSTVLSSGAAAATYSDPSQLYEALKNAQEDEATAELDLTRAEEAHKAIKLGDEGCEAIKTKTAPTAPEGADEATKADIIKKQEELAGKKTQCDAASATVEVTKTKVANAKKRTATFTALAEKHVFGLSASAGVGASFDAGGGFGQPSKESVEKVAAAVTSIVQNVTDFKEIEMTCVVRLRNPASRAQVGMRSEQIQLEAELDRECLKLVAAEATAQRLDADLRAEEARNALAVAIHTDSDVLRPYLSSGPGTAAAKWGAALDLLDKRYLVAPPLMARYRAAQSTSEILNVFEQLNRDFRTAISEAIRSGALK